MAQRQEANVPLLLTIGTISGFLVIVLVIGIQAWFLREVQTEVAQKWDTPPIQPLTNQRQEQLHRISAYRVIDAGKNQVAIPINDAIEMIVAQQGKLPTTQATKPS